MAKYTCYVKPKIYCNIYQNLAKQFTLHSVEAHSETFQTSKQGDYLLGGNYFHKNSILHVWKGSENPNAQETIKQSNYIRQKEIT